MARKLSLAISFALTACMTIGTVLALADGWSSIPSTPLLPH
jgi:hypothetical protein